MSEQPLRHYRFGREQTEYRRGRGATSNSAGRYEVQRRCDIEADFHDGWSTWAEDEKAARTRWQDDVSRSIINRNQSPDIYFDQSVNPYRGCEHGCIYCFARPTHTYLGHSAGLDFERVLYAKREAAELLKHELARPGYQCDPIAVGVNTDAYQPLERQLGITRQVLEILYEARHPVFLITKSSLIERDIDLLSAMADKNLVSTSISITTFDHELARRLEPRAASPSRRLRTLATLAQHGIPVRVSVSPVIPALNEAEIDAIIAKAAAAGACAASYGLLRLPHELATLFPQWLQQHYPDRAARILKALRSMRHDKLNDSTFGKRLEGEGPRAMIIRQRFELACRKAGISSAGRDRALDCSQFQAPMKWRQRQSKTKADTVLRTSNGQLSLF
ncbi:MAG: PA0069 family radical SAM protein [Gammaproteobacteria bacterium]|nr:PA0069 family radical SAM protein [Gammaproteobacteria bacterium]